MKVQTFEEIDSIVENWCKKYQLFVFKEYKDEEVRMIPIVDNQGTKYELWINPKQNSEFEVNLFWIDDVDKRVFRLRNKKSWEKKTNKGNLENTLNEAYVIVESWIIDLGHSREFK